MKAANDAEFDKLKELYRICFHADEKEAAEILGFAQKHGRIHYLSDGGRITSMLCICALEDGIKYLFAVATHPDYRNRGLFRKNLLRSTNSGDNIVCIPEKRSLFPLYKNLGFNKFGSVLQVRARGDGSLLAQKTHAADIDALYRIYKSSMFYPQKAAELFSSTIKYHILYRGTVITDGSFYALADGNNIYEVCLPAGEEERLPELIGKLSNGSNAVILPEKYGHLLQKSGISYRRRRFFALKSDTLHANNLYINILYN